MAIQWVDRLIGRVRRQAAGPLTRNIVSNYLAVVWLGGLGIVLIPVYLRLLGAHQWGIVAICITVQGMANLLDAGLGQILPRDIARCHDDAAAQSRIYRIYARAYAVLGWVGFCVGQGLLTLLLNGTIHWFDTDLKPYEWALRLVLLQFLFQFSNNASMGYWNGRQLQSQANLRQCFFGTLKHALALALLAGYAADVYAYVLGFAVAGGFEWWLNRRSVRGALNQYLKSSTESLNRADFRRLAEDAGVLASGVFIGMLVSQIDRILLSSQVSPAEFGRYVIVANLGLAFLQLQYPLMRALFPRVVREQAAGHMTSQSRYWVAVVVLCVLPCLVMIPLVPWILQIWLNDASVVSQGTGPLRFILGAVAVNALYHLIYQRMIARGHNRWIVMINTVVLLVIAPFLWFSGPEIGILAGGISWFIMATLQLALALIWLATRGNATPDQRIS